MARRLRRMNVIAGFIAGFSFSIAHSGSQTLAGLHALADSNGNNGGDDLDRRISEAQAKHETGASRAQGNAETRGWAVGIEFVGAVLVSGFIGWAIDNWSGLGTAPWGMIVFLVLGFAAGVRRAMKTSAQFDADDTTGDQGQ